MECSRHDERPFNKLPIIFKQYFALDADKYNKLYAEYFHKNVVIYR